MLLSQGNMKAGELAKELDMLLGCVSSLINSLGAFGSSGVKLFGLVFDFGVQTLEYWKYTSSQVLRGLEMQVGLCLCVRTDVLKKASDSA